MNASREIPKSGEVWKHFKGSLYQIIECPVIHTETDERMVCYRALYGHHAAFVRPVNMFMEEVDHEKYPEIKQKFRFELASAISKTME